MEVGPKLYLLEMTKKFIFMTVQFKCLNSDPLVNSSATFWEYYCASTIFLMIKAL